MPIRVVLVEDSPVALKILKKILQQTSQVEVVGTARTGIEALALIPKVQPQVVCTDLHMPHMDGLTLTREIMSRFPLPILVISVSVHDTDTQQIFGLLEAGAVDVFPKPVAGLSADNQALNQALIEKIRILSGVQVFKRRTAAPVVGFASRHLTAQSTPAAAQVTDFPQEMASQTDSRTIYPAVSSTINQTAVGQKRPKLVAIGASTGGPAALQAILSQLPASFLPVICVQHISLGFLQGLIDWLQQTCRLSITLAPVGEKPSPGHVYFPEENRHLILDDDGLFAYEDSPPIEGHRPSINYTFESLARYYGPQVTGVLLTGMGTDGALGLQRIAQAKGLTLVQDQTTSVIFGMPDAAIQLGGVSQVLPIEAIAPALLKFVNRFTRVADR